MEKLQPLRDTELNTRIETARYHLCRNIAFSLSAIADRIILAWMTKWECT